MNIKNTTGNIIKSIVVFFLFSRFIYAQDCSHDTIPPVLECTDSIVLKTGICGNVSIYSWDFIKKVSDNCALAIVSFDEAGLIPSLELPQFEIQYGRKNLLRIYARDSSGNSSHCNAYFTFSDELYYSNIPVPLQIFSEFDYEDYSPFQIGIGGKNGKTFWVSLDQIKNNTISVPIESTIDPKNLMLRVDSTATMDKSLITSFDLLQSVKHIVGLKNFTGTVNERNADITGDGVVDIRDLKAQYDHIRKWSPNDPNYAPRYSAQFIDLGGIVLPDTQDFHVHENKVYQLSLDQLGNINRSIPESAIISSYPVITFPGENLYWDAKDILCKQGRRYQIKFSLSDSSSFFAIQSSLDFLPDFLRVDTLYVPEQFNSKFYYKLLPEAIRFLYLNVSNPKVESDYPEFYLTFTAIKDFTLSTVLQAVPSSLSSFKAGYDNQLHTIHYRFHQIKEAEGEQATNHFSPIIRNPSDAILHISAYVPDPEEDIQILIVNQWAQPVCYKYIKLESNVFQEEIKLPSSGLFHIRLWNRNRSLYSGTAFIK